MCEYIYYNVKIEFENYIKRTTMDNSQSTSFVELKSRKYKVSKLYKYIVIDFLSI